MEVSLVQHVAWRLALLTTVCHHHVRILRCYYNDLISSCLIPRRSRVVTETVRPVAEPK